MFSRCRWALLIIGTAWLFCASAVAAEPQFDAAQLEFFEKSVRPILATRCYECHRAELEEPEGGLTLDTRAGALKGGETGPAIVPGDVKESLLVDAINYGNTYQMPPKFKLPPDEIATLTKWVAMGAPWPKGVAKKAFDLAERKSTHWAWQPIRAAAPPPVKNGDWATSPLDAFILAKLEAKGLAPNKRADKRVLIRRAYFDLIGLPPTPAQVDAFVQDESAGAFAKVVDQLLESPRFGERWGRHWLDLVRYAESRGHEFDADIPNVWHYRDYVIRALNADVPYDQFVTEHVAGDLLEKPRLNPEEGFNESVLGTGFWHLGEWVHSPVDIRKDECDRYDNMVDVFSKTFLAMTVSCARCHDHKFDAISQKDYYALYGYLQSSDYRQAAFDSEPANRQVALEMAKVDDAAQEQVLTAYQQATAPLIKSLPAYLAAAKEVLAGTAPVTAKRETIEAIAAGAKLDADLLAAWVDYLPLAGAAKDDPLQPLAALLMQSEAAFAQKRDALAAREKLLVTEHEAAQAKHKVVVDYNDPKAEWIVDGYAFGLRPVRAGELSLRTDGQAPLVAEVAQYGMARRDPRWKGLTRAPGTQAESQTLSRFEAPGQMLRTPTFEITHDTVAYLVQGGGRAYACVDSHRLVAGPLHGQTVTEWDNSPGPRWIVQNLAAYKGHGVHIEFSPRGNDDLRVLMVVSGIPPAPRTTTPDDLAAPLFANAKTLADLTTAYVAALETATQPRLRAWLIEHANLLASADQHKALIERLKAIGDNYQRENARLAALVKRSSRTAPAMWDGSGEDERLLLRGNPATPKDVVPRRFLTAVSGPKAPEYERGSGRLDLARQVLSESNPLTARVMANRVWHHLLGRGIAPQTDNFGVLGQEPTHPDLLDYLATEFRREGWSVKRLIRTIMLTSTYQMDSAPGAADKEADPQNLLWHRANIRRLEAEVIRDQMLFLGGRFNDKMYGPSVPVFLTPYMQGRGRPGGGPLNGDGRRSIYVSVRRNFLSPMMLAFDTPVPFSTMGKRNVSNVPAQALTMMNDPLVIEQAKAWTRRVLTDTSLSTTDARIAQLYQQAFARAPSAEELANANAFLAAQAAELKLPPEAAKNDERVWADLGHVLMNVKEFIFIP
jgi:hypothetical protein